MLLFDGAMGSMLQQAGMPAGAVPEEYNIDDPALIERIHREYLRAGADILTTNSFGCNAFKMKDSRYAAQDMIRAALGCARRAVEAEGKRAYIALDIGPIGQLMEPMGTLKFEEAYALFRDMIVCAKDMADVILFETMSDLYEVKAGVLAAKENSTLPVFVSMTYERSGRTLSGCDPLTMVNVLEGLGVDALGVNCSLGPDELGDIMEEVLSHAHVPVFMQPNAGLPHLEHGVTCYAMDAQQFAQRTVDYAQRGVSILGGCCGTTPQGIALLRQKMPKMCVRRDNPYRTIVSSGVRSVCIGDQPVVCGERLNPTGKKKLKQALLEERYEDVRREGVLQDQAGAQVLDVNVGVPGIDEQKVMPKVIAMLQEVLTLPLQIDTSDPQAMEAACRRYNGRPLMNSVNGKRETMEQIFPIAKKYGGVVIGLTLDEEGIPDTAEKRVAIAQRIIDTARSYGIPSSSIIIDTLVLTASAQQEDVLATVQALHACKEELGVRTILGVSNISFGLPCRSYLNTTFLTMAMYAGLDLAIMNPSSEEMMAAVYAYNVLTNRDRQSTKYIERYANRVPASAALVQAVQNAQTAPAAGETPEAAGPYAPLMKAVEKGLKGEAAARTRALLEEKEPLELVDEALIPALDIVGAKYEKGTLFLPQLLQAATAAQGAFEEIKTAIAQKGEGSASKGRIVIATVKGDVHDIGKNIVRVILENYGFEVIDLGRDVPVETVVNTVREKNVHLVGLSALMTTTLKSMEETIRALHDAKLDCKIMVGGAVLTPEYAKKIGADWYAKDAKQSADIAKEFFGV